MTGREVNELLLRKNEEYGNSLFKSDPYLSMILGMPESKVRMARFAIRLIEKLDRLQQFIDRDIFLDIAGLAKIQILKERDQSLNLTNLQVIDGETPQEEVSSYRMYVLDRLSKYLTSGVEGYLLDIYGATLKKEEEYEYERTSNTTV